MLSNNDKTYILNSFNKKGYHFPIDLLTEQNNFYYHKYIECIKRIKKKSLQFEHKFKSHLIFKWVNDLMKSEKILSLVKPILGNNILCWNSILFFKPKKTKYFVGWHEDKTYWRLKNDNIVTVSIALSDSNPENGCLKILKKKIDNVTYKINQPRFNMLARGQEAIISENEEFDYITLKSGQCAIFNQKTVHGSEPNNSDQDRLLLAFRYITPDNSTEMNHKSATIVCGKDNYGFYEQEPIPDKDFQNNCIKYHQRLMSKQAMIFGKSKLKKFSLDFLTPILKYDFIRSLYYNYFK